MKTVPPLTTWYWQLQGAVNTTRPATVYDFDLAENSAELVASLKAKGHTVIGYFSAGTWEDFRDDASQFPTSVRGKGNGWPGEKWLDIRSPTVRNLMLKRLDVAKAKGFDGVEPDCVDGYTNATGFPLTEANQISYNKFLAAAAHERGMIVALKNTAELVATLVSYFDFAIAEESFRYHEASSYSPFINQGKAVLAAEYTTYSATKCAKAKALQFSLVFYGLSLNGRKYQPCS